MRYVGIVGAGHDKFTAEQRKAARALIAALLVPHDTILVSGRSPVGGVDVWAEEEADRLCRQKVIHAPRVEQWDPLGQYGYKARNLDIAKSSDEVRVIVVKDYPSDYNGMRFDGCYHCMGRNDNPSHVKSGGCWTGIQAQKLGKKVVWYVL